MQSDFSGGRRAPVGRGQSGEIDPGTLARVLKAIQCLREDLFRVWMADLRSEPAQDAAVAAIDDLLGLAVLVHLIRQVQGQAIPSLAHAISSVDQPSVRAVHRVLREQAPDSVLAAALEAAPFRCNRPLPTRVAQFATRSWLFSGESFPSNMKLPLGILGDLHQLCLGRPLRFLFRGRPDSHRLGGKRHDKGIYYTPAALVDYLAGRTLDSGAIPAKLLPSIHVRVLDPSCGCGAFLISALARLIDSHRARTPLAREGRSVELSAQSRLDLLASAIHGYDIDRRAISIATCLLLLTVWRSCIADGTPLDRRDKLLVPDLAHNLVCADFLDSRTGRHLKEAGGVDVVLGGPPFVRIEQLFRTQRSRISEYRRHFMTARSGQFDLYMLFVEKALLLLREHGQLAVSVSSSFLRSASGSILRGLIARQCHVHEIVQFTCSRVYPDASVQVALLHLRKSPPPEPTRYVLLNRPEALSLSMTTKASGGHLSGIERIQLLPADSCRSAHWTLASEEDALLLRRIEAVGISLSDLGINVRLGACTGADDIFLVNASKSEMAGEVCRVQTMLGEYVHIERATLRPVLRGRNVGAWREPQPATYCVCPYDSDGRLVREHRFRRTSPLAYRYLRKHQAALRARNLAEAQPWYSFRRPCLAPMMAAPKLVAGSIGSLAFTLDSAGVLCHNSVVMISSRTANIDPFFLLGVLNSRLFSTYALHRAPSVRFGGYALRIHMLREFPLALPYGKYSEQFQNQIAQRSRELLARTVARHAPRADDPALDQLVWQLYRIPTSCHGQHARRYGTTSRNRTS